MGLEKWSNDLEFEKFVGYLSLLDFKFVSTQVWLSYSFLYQILLLWVDQKKEYMKKIVGKVIDNMTWGVISSLTL